MRVKNTSYFHRKEAKKKREREGNTTFVLQEKRCSDENNII
jgi:hypothetical protein